jgi:hypothetical protein
MRKRDRAYSKMQKHGNKGKYRDKFKMLKHLAQKKKTRETYWNYISDIIAPVDSTNEYYWQQMATAFINMYKCTYVKTANEMKCTK